jgi:hypothetical protein
MKPENFARYQDVPIFNSPPVQFAFEQSITVNGAGNYVWPVNRQDESLGLDINEHSLYLFETYTFAADIDSEDYKGAISVRPTFRLYLKSEGANPQLKQPIQLPLYMNNFPYKMALLPRVAETNGVMTEENFLMGSFSGTLFQIPSLIGKRSINLVMVLSAQEVTNDDFILKFMAQYGNREK